MRAVYAELGGNEAGIEGARQTAAAAIAAAREHLAWFEGLCK